MAKEHFVMLAHTFEEGKHRTSGQFLSEKMDGMRFVWDGGVTAGLPTEEVPWANVERSNQVPVATGLWSRYGNAINAPSHITNKLPPYPVEGEFWIGYRKFQKVMSICRSTVNAKDWSSVKMHLFDLPDPHQWLRDRFIDLKPNYVKHLKGCYQWWLDRGGQSPLRTGTPFQTRYSLMVRDLPNLVLYQERLPLRSADADARVKEFYAEVLERHGEGIVLKGPQTLWVPERIHGMLKHKPEVDGEAMIVGYTGGRETDRGSRHLGRMGALIVKNEIGEFKLSGFDDYERELVYLMTGKSAAKEVEQYEAKPVPDTITNPKLPRGMIVTYTYRETTDKGLPKEGRFLRERPAE